MRKIKATKLGTNPRKQFRIGGKRNHVADRQSFSTMEEEAKFIEYIRKNSELSDEEIAEQFGVLPQQVKAIRNAII